MIIGDLANYILRAGRRADRNSHGTLDSFLSFFENELKMRAPIDSGDFSNSWSSMAQKGSDGSTATISNSKPYASAIEFGSSPGGKPWPNPGPKTAMKDGRIFSSQAVGGTIDKAFNNNNVKELANAIASSILRAFK